MKSIIEHLRLSKTIKDRMNDDISSESEEIQDELKIPEFMNVNNNDVSRRNDSDFEIPSFLSNPGVIKFIDNTPMTQAEIDILRDRIRGMSKAEKLVVVEALPVDICIDRIKSEYEKNQIFINSIKDSLAALSIDM